MGDNLAERIKNILIIANEPLKTIDIARIIYLIGDREWDSLSASNAILEMKGIDWKDKLKGNILAQREIDRLKNKLIRLQKYLVNDVEFVNIRAIQHWKLKDDVVTELRVCMHSDCERFEDPKNKYTTIYTDKNNISHRININGPLCSEHYKKEFDNRVRDIGREITFQKFKEIK